MSKYSVKTAVIQYFYLLSEWGGTGQTGPLWRGRAVQGERADQAWLRASRRHCVFDGEEHRAAEEEDGLADTLRSQRNVGAVTHFWGWGSRSRNLWFYFMPHVLRLTFNILGISVLILTRHPLALCVLQVKSNENPKTQSQESLEQSLQVWKSIAQHIVRSAFIIWTWNNGTVFVFLPHRFTFFCFYGNTTQGSTKGLSTFDSD